MLQVLHAEQKPRQGCQPTQYPSSSPWEQWSCHQDFATSSYLRAAIVQLQRWRIYLRQWGSGPFDKTLVKSLINLWVGPTYIHVLKTLVKACPVSYTNKRLDHHQAKLTYPPTFSVVAWCSWAHQLSISYNVIIFWVLEWHVMLLGMEGIAGCWN